MMTEIKYLRPELLEAIARNTLKKYDSKHRGCYDKQPKESDPGRDLLEYE